MQTAQPSHQKELHKALVDFEKEFKDTRKRKEAQSQEKKKSWWQKLFKIR